jgi:hypothetical protein
MKAFKAGETVRPKAKFLPIDSEIDGRTGRRHQIKNDAELLVNTVSIPRNGEQTLSFRGVRGSYDSSFFERVTK